LCTNARRMCNNRDFSYNIFSAGRLFSAKILRGCKIRWRKRGKIAPGVDFLREKKVFRPEIVFVVQIEVSRSQKFSNDILQTDDTHVFIISRGKKWVRSQLCLSASRSRSILLAKFLFKTTANTYKCM
jgi:hypothetical protein